MAIDTQFDYSNLLSLNKAKLATSSRENHLGTKELILDYQLQTNAAKQEAVEWLEANRLTITDPEFSYKTYEGTWTCVSIEYPEGGNVIRQRFKIDSSMLNDVAQRSQAGTVFRDYYWRVVDPRDYNIPAWTTEGTTTPVDLDGVLWYDTHQDQGGETVYSGSGLSLWYTGSLWVITDGGVGDTLPANYYSSSTLEGAYSATGSWTGSPVVGFDSNYEWSKTANDNGDGTYDVIISREEANDQSGTSDSKTVGEQGNTGTEASKSIFVSGLLDCDGNGEYELVYDFWVYNLDGTPAPPTTLIDKRFYNTGTTNDGEAVYYDENDVYASWYDSGNDKWYITLIANVGIPTATDRYEGECRISKYTGFGAWFGTPTLDDIFRYAVSGLSSQKNIFYSVLQNVPPLWRHVTNTDWTITNSGSAWVLYDGVTLVKERNFQNLNSSAWFDSSSSALDPNFVIQIGANPPAVVESSVVSTNSDELSFVSDGGTVADPVDGEDKSISNAPLANGKFRTTITSRKVNQQRIPALFDSIVYASSGNKDETALIVAKNATYEQMQKDITLLSESKITLQNSVSVSINRFGRYDYTIRSTEIIDIR